MYKVFETENFLKSLEQDFGSQREKIKKKLRKYVYLQLKASPEIGPNIKRLRDWQPLLVFMQDRNRGKVLK
jgi:hypothetical protein